MTNTNLIQLEQFEAEHPIRVMGGKTRWEPCRVIGVAYRGKHVDGEFVILKEDEEGTLYVSGADYVRRVE
jgi:hypothetical protein